MPYERTNWVCGDVVTADKLNNLENGVEEALECCSGGGTASEPLIVTFTTTSNFSGRNGITDVDMENLTCDTPYADIATAIEQGKIVYAMLNCLSLDDETIWSRYQLTVGSTLADDDLILVFVATSVYYSDAITSEEQVSIDYTENELRGSFNRYMQATIQ